MITVALLGILCVQIVLIIRASIRSCNEDAKYFQMRYRELDETIKLMEAIRNKAIQTYLTEWTASCDEASFKHIDGSKLSIPDFKRMLRSLGLKGTVYLETGSVNLENE